MSIKDQIASHQKGELNKIVALVTSDGELFYFIKKYTWNPEGSFNLLTTTEIKDACSVSESNINDMSVQLETFGYFVEFYKIKI